MTAKKMFNFSDIKIKRMRSKSPDYIMFPCEVSPEMMDVATDLLSASGADVGESHLESCVNVYAFMVPVLSADNAKCWLRLAVDDLGIVYTRWLEVEATPNQVYMLMAKFLSGTNGVTKTTIDRVKAGFFAYMEKHDSLENLLVCLIHERYDPEDLLELLDGYR